MSDNNDGPAFPVAFDGDYLGISRREFYASQALPAILAEMYRTRAKGEDSQTFRTVAADAFKVADRMLAESSKNG